jgi:hypothetical protein
MKKVIIFFGVVIISISLFVKNDLTKSSSNLDIMSLITMNEANAEEGDLFWDLVHYDCEIVYYDSNGNYIGTFPGTYSECTDGWWSCWSGGCGSV